MTRNFWDLENRYSDRYIDYLDHQLRPDLEIAKDESLGQKVVMTIVPVVRCWVGIGGPCRARVAQSNNKKTSSASHSLNNEVTADCFVRVLDSTNDYVLLLPSSTATYGVQKRVLDYYD